jgi:hypothetical protein
MKYEVGKSGALLRQNGALLRQAGKCYDEIWSFCLFFKVKFLLRIGIAIIEIKNDIIIKI